MKTMKMISLTTRVIAKSYWSLLALAGILSASPSFAAPTLTGGTVSGAAGTDVDLVINFNPTPNSVASLQFTIPVPVNLSTVSVTAGAAATNAGKQVSSSLVGSNWNIIVFGLNTTAINSGVIVTARMHIAGNAPAGNITVPISGAVYADANGASITPGTSVNGTITVTSVVSAPVVTSAQTASGAVGSAFNYQITATNSPASFGATGLPAGLSVNTNTGLISGTPTTAGTSNITVSATNAGGTGTRALTLTVTQPTPAPVVTSAQTASGTVGTAFSYQITATNSPTSFGATGLPAGLSVNTTSGLISGTPSTSGTSNITVSATNSGGTGTRALTLTVNPANNSQPSLSGGSTSGPAGGSATVPVTFFPGTTGVASLQFVVGLPSGWTFISFSTGAASQSAGKSVTGNTSNGNVVIFGLNQNTIGSGVVANIQVGIPAGTAAGNFPITLTAAVYSDANGGSVTGTAPSNGSVSVTAGSGGLPTPVLTLPSVLPLDADITLTNAGSYTGATFTWNVTPVPSSVIGFRGAGALGVPMPVSATSAVPRLQLATLNLTAGTYLITVQASNGSQTSAMASATVTLVQANLNAVRAYPNPWRSDRHGGVDITFDNLSTGSEVKLFTVSGHSVRTLTPSAATPDRVVWDRKNDSGDVVASGIYVYSIKDSSGSKSKGKIAIIK